MVNEAMRNLLDFLFKYGYWLLFVVLECISLLLLFRFNNYQGSIAFTSANRIAGQIHAFSAEVSSFFMLKGVNEELVRHNLTLETENELLRKALRRLTTEDSTLIQSLTELRQKETYRTVSANVINNSLNNRDNYLTLDKGTADGIRPEMGVICGNGLVGIVYMVSEHYSLVISLLNSKSSISCKFKYNNYFGFLKWREGDSRFAYLEDVPRHALFEQGDTIVTSGHSAVFPKGLMVGTVEHIDDSSDGMSYLLRIRLSTNFACLDNVLVLINGYGDEQDKLEEITKERK